MDSIYHSNLTLLPYDSTVVIKDIGQKQSLIELMQALLLLLQKSLNHFEQKQWDQFDAQVGDTLCQVRAYKVHYLATFQYYQTAQRIQATKAKVTQTLADLEHHRAQLEHFITQPKHQRPELVRAPITLEDFFKELNCVFMLDEDLIFLFLSYVLCLFHVKDEDDIPIALDFDAIKQSLSLSRSYSKKIGHFYQKKLAELSCEFMFRLIDEMPKWRHITSLLKKLHLLSDEGRLVLPCYDVTELILAHMLEHEAHLIVLVDSLTNSSISRQAYTFQGSVLKQHFLPSKDISEEQAPQVIFYGTTTFSQEQLQGFIWSKSPRFFIKELFLSNNAAHPQYSGVALKDYQENPYSILLRNEPLSKEETTLATQRERVIQQMKVKARSLGCSHRHPKTFLLKHIFCSSLDVIKDALGFNASKMEYMTYL